MTATNNNLNLSETEKRLETAPAKGSIEKAFDQAVDTIQKRLEKSLNKITLTNTVNGPTGDEKKNAILGLIEDIQDPDNATLDVDRIDKIKSVLSDKNVPDDIKEQIAWLYGYAREINDLESSYKAELGSLVNGISSEITQLFGNFPSKNAKKISSAFKEVKAEGAALPDEIDKTFSNIGQLSLKEREIDLQFDGMTMKLDGKPLDISTNVKLDKALNYILEISGTLTNKNTRINWAGVTPIFQAMVDSKQDSGTKWTGEAVKKLIKDNNIHYKKKGAFILDWNSDYKQIATIANAFGDKLPQLVSIRKNKLNVAEVANAKESQKKLTAQNVFTWLVDRDSTGKLNDGIDNQRFSEEALMNVLKNNANATQGNDNESWEFTDGPMTEDVIDAFIMHVGAVEGVDKVKKLFVDSANKITKTLETLVSVLKSHPEYKVIYLNQLTKWVTNKAADLSDVTSGKKFQKMMMSAEYKNDSASLEMNNYSSADKKAFELYLTSLSAEDRKIYQEMTSKEKTSLMYGVFNGLKILGPVASAALNYFGIPVSINGADAGKMKEDLVKNGMDVTLKLFKDPQGRGITVEPIIEMKDKEVYNKNGEKVGAQKMPNSLKFGVNVPILSGKYEKTVNKKSLAAANEEELKSLNSLYVAGTIKAGAYVDFNGAKYLIKKGSDKTGWPETLGAGLRVALEGSLGFERGFREGTEYMSDTFGERLTEMLPSDNNSFKNKDTLQKAMKAKIATMGKDKKFEQYIKQNPGALEAYAETIVNTLEATGAFGLVANNPEALANLQVAAKNLAKGIVGQVEWNKTQALNGDVKWTSAFVTANAGLNFVLGKGGADKGPAISYGAGLGMSFSSFLVKYLPDAEKLKYMDDKLLLGDGMRSIEGWKLSDGVNSMATKLSAIMKVPGLVIKNVDNKLVFSVDKTKLNAQNGEKVDGDITKLLNIYMPAEQKNVAIVDNELIVGNVSALNFTNRTYFHTEENYLIIGGGGTNGKTIQRQPVGAAGNVGAINTKAFSEDTLKTNLAKALGVKENDDLITSVVGKTIRINEETGKYEYKTVEGDTEWKTLDITKQGLSVSGDKVGNKTVTVTNEKGKIDVATAAVDKVVDTSDILDINEKKLYENIKKLIVDIKFGPLVSMLEKKDSAFEKQVNDYRKTKWRDKIQNKQTAFAAIMDHVGNKITDTNKKTGLKSIDDLKVEEKKALKKNIDSVLVGLKDCTDKASPCDFLMRVFDAQFANSYANALKNGTIVDGDIDKTKKIRGKSTDEIQKMTIKEYTDGFLGRGVATHDTLRNLGYTEEDWGNITNARNELINHIRGQKSWTISETPSTSLVWNINMSRNIQTYSLLPVGEANMAKVGNDEMEFFLADSEHNTIKKKLITDLKSNNFAGYKELLQRKLKLSKDVTDEEMQTLLSTGEATIDGKKVIAEVKTKFGFYGACFNDALMLDISKIKIERNGATGTVALDELTGMKVGYEEQTATKVQDIEENKAIVSAAVNGMKTIEERNASSATGNDEKNGDTNKDSGGGNHGEGGDGNGGGSGGSNAPKESNHPVIPGATNPPQSGSN